MNREEMIQKLQEQTEPWDVVIIGGGATGLGAAVDSASRGYKTLLIEGSDFAKGTSSRSTKLIHGGLRYLEQGNISLVIEALKERGLLCQNAPHLVHHLPFLVPNYKWWEGPFYGIGLKIYDLLAGKLGLEPSKHLSKKQTLKAISSLNPQDLRGGVVYYDGQFDDARLAITLAQTAIDHGGVVINYMKAVSLIKDKKGVCVGLKAIDQESKKSYKINAKAIINATGSFCDDLLKMDNPQAKKIIAHSQGVHLVLPKKFMPGDTAILVPHTDDGRVVFIIPWHDRILLGTTDTPVAKPTLEPKAQEEEIEFLLRYAKRYLKKAPKKEDVLSVFAGLRPLVRPKTSKETAAISRDHSIMISKSGLITIAGGKWTTYRKMAEDVIDQAAIIGDLPQRSCITQNLQLHGAKKGLSFKDHSSVYGSDLTALKQLTKEKKALKAHLHPKLPYTQAEVIWAARFEMARTIEDVLARRTRALFLDAKAALEIAPLVAKILAKELNYGVRWQQKELKAFRSVAKNYCLTQESYE